WGWNGNYSFNIYLPLKFQISSEGRYNYTAPTQLFEESLERFIIDASVSKKFLKDETLKLTVGMNDILNQNVGVNRSASNNMFVQDRYTAITRLLMFSLTWDFNKMGGVTVQN